MFIKRLAASVRDFIRTRSKLMSLARSHPELTHYLLECAAAEPAQTRIQLERLFARQVALRAFCVEFDDFSSRLVRAGYPALDRAEAYPCLDDRTAETAFDRHYIYHPAWAARVVASARPRKHVDISSTLHFATIMSAFMDVAFYDYRPAPLHLSHLTSGPADLTHLAFDSDSIESISCMHVIEHIGLGRYGDPHDIDGDRKAAAELARVLAPGGRLIVAFPVGRPRIQFNAHRIYSHAQVLDLFSGLKVVEYALIPDGAVEDGMIQDPEPELIASQNYGCGCYVFSK